jgi:hypothetical protein
VIMRFLSGRQKYQDFIWLIEIYFV